MQNVRCRARRWTILYAACALLGAWAALLATPNLAAEVAEQAEQVVALRPLALAEPSTDAPAKRSPAAIIDRRMRQRWDEIGQQPASAATDAEFVRRVYLDLTGRIPSQQELREFCQDSTPGKRDRLVDRLLASDEFVIHFANQLNALLLGRTAFPPPADWIDWLRGALEARQGWDLISKELILPQSATPEDRGASEFLIRRLSAGDSLDTVTRDATRLLLGVDMQCARCHTHPEVYDWEPANYWGIAAFFNRTYVVDIDGKKLLAERARGEVDYTDVETKESQTASPLFMTGATPAPQPAPPEEPAERLEERKAKYADAKSDSPLLDNPDEYVIAPAEKPTAGSQPIYSRRAEFVKLAIDQENPYFARAIVNRVWSWLLGQGLVEPLDQLHDGNEPTHPELLGELTEDFVEHGYDLHRLVQGIATSEVYQLSSVRHSSGSPPPAEEYLQARLKPLSAHQLATSILCAVGTFDETSRRDAEVKHAELLSELIQQFDPGSDQFQHGLPLALYLANNRSFAELIRGGPLLSQLAAIGDDQEMIRTMFQSVLSRDPDADEAEMLRSFLLARPMRREKACEHLLWSLLTSSEFRFNH